MQQGRIYKRCGHRFFVRSKLNEYERGDVLASLTIVLCFFLASRPPDRCHHFGHGKVEFVVTAMVSLLLLYIAYELVMTTMVKIGAETIAVPGALAL